MDARPQVSTVRGYDFFEVSSAFQKSIRRGEEEDALYWAVELDLSGRAQYVWKRMLVMVSEDIGLAEPHLPATIRALHQTWLDFKAKNDKHKPERLQFIHAVLLLARAKKSRIVDHAICVAYGGGLEERDIPDYALDKHTRRGKRMGRGFDHFFKECIKLENEPDDLPDEYEEDARYIYTHPDEFEAPASTSTRKKRRTGPTLYGDD